MSEVAAVIEPSIAGLKLLGRGKVRHLFELGDELLLVASDRISAFDCVLPTGIPEKGRLLTQISLFWFEHLKQAQPHHLISAELSSIQAAAPGSSEDLKALDGRMMRCRKVDIVPFECIVRGYLAGSAWKDYQKTGSAFGHALPAGLELGSPLPKPIFTPTTKAESGHDAPVSYDEVAAAIGEDLASRLRARSLALFEEAQGLCRERGLILCDTKFEFGTDADGALVLADEVLTPDSSRFYMAAEYKPGQPVIPWDKQHVRNYLLGLDWDRDPSKPPPALPAEVVAETTRRYQKIYEHLCGA